MQFFSNPLPVALFLLVLILHFASAAFSCTVERIIKYANIFLHIVLFFVLMLCKIPLQEAALLYLLSLLFYLLAYLFWERVHCMKKKNEEKKGGKEIL